MSAGTIGHPDRDTLAAYCLGGLDARETAAHDTHLATCAACREYADELGAVRDMLAMVPAPLVLDDPSLTGDPPATPARPAGARRVSRHQRPWPQVAAIAAAIVVGAFVIPDLVGGGTGQAGPRPALTGGSIAIAATGTSTSFDATMLLYPGTTACRFTLTLTNLGSVPRFQIVGYLTDGSTVSGGWWTVPAEGAGRTYELPGSVPAPMGDVSYFVLRTAAGTALSTLKVPHGSAP